MSVAVPITNLCHLLGIAAASIVEQDISNFVVTRCCHRHYPSRFVTQILTNRSSMTGASGSATYNRA